MTKLLALLFLVSVCSILALGVNLLPYGPSASDLALNRGFALVSPAIPCIVQPLLVGTRARTWIVHNDGSVFTNDG